MTTDDELRELIALGDKATARPWKCGHVHDVKRQGSQHEVHEFVAVGITITGTDANALAERVYADRDYMEAAANLAPEIAAELIAARALVEQLRKAIESVRDVGWYSPVTPEYKAAWKKVDATLKGGGA